MVLGMENELDSVADIRKDELRIVCEFPVVAHLDGDGFALGSTGSSWFR